MPPTGDPNVQSSWRRWLSVVAVLASASLNGCNSPTLPLPPPAWAEVHLSSGQAVVVGNEYDAEPHADVICFNRKTDVGRVTSANASGAYELRIPASAGDPLECWQRIDGHSSSSVSLVVPAEQ
ncbi:MAG TPA: hypothetical protein PLI95_15565 [Polyangiaceae bacterium]|nr:hypothetical protein [Polyangiaceae bacterium]